MTDTKSAPASVGLHLHRIFHAYGDTPVVDGVSLAIAPGELVALPGPSGCRKTRLLKIVAGFNRQLAGQVRIGGETIDHLPPNRRRVGIVFQNYALFPHMTVAQNVAYGLDVMRMQCGAKAARVQDMLGLVRMDGLADRYPRQLSGGQQQRVAIARALVKEPKVLLADEPTGNLDEATRDEIMALLEKLWRDLGITLILVTHETSIARRAQRIAVMSKGRLAIRPSEGPHESAPVTPLPVEDHPGPATSAPAS
jgi:putative spermidine/putrescine transport system ATP-binding protein